ARIFRLQGKGSEAEQVYLRIVQITGQAVGEDNPEYARALSNLGTLQAERMRYEDAEKHLRQARTILMSTAEKKYSSYIVGVTTNLADICREQNRYSEAQALYEEALLAAERTNDKLLATVLDKFAMSTADQGRYAEAEGLMKRALAVRERELGG